MPLRKNPFAQVYLTELISADGYIHLFSPFLINDTLAVFQPGNIILEGVQGSGKSMLLTLLKPEIQIAYQEAKLKFPVPDEFSRFIGAGINLIRSGAIDFGTLLKENAGEQESNLLKGLYGDFVNYCIIDDILDRLEVYSRNEVIKSSLCINCNPDNLNHFVLELKDQGCWFG